MPSWMMDPGDAMVHLSNACAVTATIAAICLALSTRGGGGAEKGGRAARLAVAHCSTAWHLASRQATQVHQGLIAGFQARGLQTSLVDLHVASSQSGAAKLTCPASGGREDTGTVRLCSCLCLSCDLRRTAAKSRPPPQTAIHTFPVCSTVIMSAMRVMLALRSIFPFPHETD